MECIVEDNLECLIHILSLFSSKEEYCSRFTNFETASNLIQGNKRFIKCFFNFDLTEKVFKPPSIQIVKELVLNIDDSIIDLAYNVLKWDYEYDRDYNSLFYWAYSCKGFEFIKVAILDYGLLLTNYEKFIESLFDERFFCFYQVIDFIKDFYNMKIWNFIEGAEDNLLIKNFNAHVNLNILSDNASLCEKRENEFVFIFLREISNYYYMVDNWPEELEYYDGKTYYSPVDITDDWWMKILSQNWDLIKENFEELVKIVKEEVQPFEETIIEILHENSNTLPKDIVKLILKYLFIY